MRQPAALCGIVGLKPTYGSVSRYGMIAFASSLDQAGPLTRDVTDAALLLEHMVGRDQCDATSLQFPEPIARPRAERLDGVRLGVPAELQNPGAEFAGADVEPGVRAAFERALALAQELGASVQEIHLPHAAHALSAYYILSSSEASSNLARFDGVRYGMRARGRDGPAGHVHAHAPRRLRRRRSSGASCSARTRCRRATTTPTTAARSACARRSPQDFKAAFADVDLIVTPTSANVAFALGEKTADPWSMYLSDFFTVPMSLAGIPAISIPCGLSGDCADAGPARRGPAGRPADRRAGVQREPAARRRVRAGAGDRLRGGQRACLSWRR